VTTGVNNEVMCKRMIVDEHLKAASERIHNSLLA